MIIWAAAGRESPVGTAQLDVLMWGIHEARGWEGAEWQAWTLAILDIYCFRTEAPGYSIWGHSRERSLRWNYLGKSLQGSLQRAFLYPKSHCLIL